MKLQLMDIEAYLAAVESGSISKAARRIGVAKSILSKRVARLEQSLGAPGVSSSETQRSLASL